MKRRAVKGARQVSPVWRAGGVRRFFDKEDCRCHAIARMTFAVLFDGFYLARYRAAFVLFC